MVRTLKGLKSKRSQLIGRKIKQISRSRIRSEIDFLNLEESEKRGSQELGVVLHRNITGSNKAKQQIISSINHEIILAFKGKPNTLNSFLNNPRLPKKQRIILVAYASTYISRLLDKCVRNKFGKIKRTSKPVNLSPSQINEIVKLLAGVNGLNKNKLEQLVRTCSLKAKNLDTRQHFQISAISVLSKYVFSKNPQLSPNEFISHFLKTLNRSENYDDFYNELSDKTLPQNKNLFRLLGMESKIESKTLIYSKKVKPATILHELLHSILKFSGKKALSWNEPFVTMISNIWAEKSGLDVGYLTQRKNFAKNPMYAIANFPWRNITSRDIYQLSKQVETLVENNNKLKKSGFSEFNKIIVSQLAPLFFNLLEQKLSKYSKSDKKMVYEIARQGINDCSGRQELDKIKHRLERLIKLTG